ncbi:hypothetical protein UP10_41695 [Bradyrhizobium sp. LTSPM299]|uniref:hypothetical protein n=1 Tax=Bradyrhizobium sp. LTSPM299 TaxID=1619233 RepID=UPI0005C860E4|nr:hypothetical protein [Bradyrhizobium sp. LTSPM299]KJC53620.1 hypothetical protein UP10_41695 [Bradyrhizobium sp. LTSPM299]
MRKSNWTPVILPGGQDLTVYMVVDDFGRNGPAYPETSAEPSDRETIIQALLEGRYVNPTCVFAFSPAKGWSQDASADIAEELRRRCDLQKRDLPLATRNFVERHEGLYPRFG